MASRKQRRRAEKLRRHEYEYVVETPEGEEVPVERPRAARAGSTRANGVPRDGAVRDRRGRVIPPPSLHRVLKRSLLFFIPMGAFLWYLGGRNEEIAPVAFALNAILLFLFLVGVGYSTDTLVYRRMQKRQRSGRS